ncbi:phospholipid-translocating ATPase [Paragonimus westermani]|uniref:Phospholipid-translocating ATPase n=1 Tax=Paragonimus westermani TaxID=34504 RepID=A0A5J4NXP7_9TREM|nr:phospholipid-translocating ATPase [Paragonimus westermani]
MELAPKVRRDEVLTSLVPYAFSVVCITPYKTEESLKCGPPRKTFVSITILKRMDLEKASSPDDRALVEAAALLGLRLVSTQPDPNDNETRRLLIECRLTEATTDSREEAVTRLEYLVDAVLEFDSLRKRMTVMARHPDGTFNIHSKGAESSMLEPEVCSGSNSRIRTMALNRANDFAVGGLRTLVFATRQLTAEEYYQLLSEHRAALCLLGNARSQALKASGLKIESGLEVLGVTGVEDKLQTGVKECLEDLRNAGIQIWVLTGDKEETAVTVSQAAGHFPERMALLRITGCSDYEAVAYQIFQHLSGLDARDEQRRVQERRRKKNNFTLDYEPPLTVLRVYGPSMEEVDEVIMTTIELQEDEQSEDRLKNFKNPSGSRKRLIGFVNSQQKGKKVLRKPNRRGRFKKASIVELVHVGLAEQCGDSPVTAAIGDGGNDVSMLLQANVGIGIYGKEGREAARAADYAIPQFQ